MRYPLIDLFRGIAILSMVFYHFLWDLVFLGGTVLPWYRGTAGYLWQQSICWTFIFVSGFSLALSLRHRKRASAFKKGLLLMGIGCLITMATLLFMPAHPIWFGVLFLLGSSALVMSLLGGRTKLPAPAALLFFVLCFVVTRNVPSGFLGFERLTGPALPPFLYTYGLAGAFFGFAGNGFFSADYFPFIPWFFLFASGFFTCRSLLKDGTLPSPFSSGSGPVAFLGRHSLLVYLIHQPLLLVLIPGIPIL